jgi:hypothetical protein
LIAEFLLKLQEPKPFIHAWHLYRFLPFGRGGAKNQKSLLLDDEVYERIVSQTKARNLPFKVFKRKDMLLSQTVEFFWVENNQLLSQSRINGRRPYSTGQ